MSHRLICAAFPLLLAGGCGTLKTVPRPNPAPAPVAGSAQTPPAAAPGRGNAAARGPLTELPHPGSPPNALALETAALAETQASQLELLLARHGRPATQPGGVDPLNAANINLTLGPPQEINARKVGSGFDSGPATANRVAALIPRPVADPTKPESAAIVAAPGADPLERTLAQQMKDAPTELPAQLDNQLWQLLHDGPVPQAEVMAPLPAEDRAILSALMDGLSNFRMALRTDTNMLAARKVRPLLEMADRLRAAADLRIPTTALCTRVDGFGVYEPIEPARFPAGKERPVILYCEVENFASQLTDKRVWETRLTQEAVLYTEAGLMVWEDTDSKVKPVIDSSRNRRHDFFMVKLVQLPASLTPGRYLLKVTINDQISQRIAETTVAIQIVGQ